MSLQFGYETLDVGLLLPPANEVWGKVIFSQASVILSMGGDFSACITGHMTRGSAQPSCRQTPLPLDTDTLDAEPPEWRPLPPRYMEYYGIRSTSRRYASYWNAFLLTIKTIHLVCFTETSNDNKYRCHFSPMVIFIDIDLMQIPMNYM